MQTYLYLPTGNHYTNEFEQGLKKKKTNNNSAKVSLSLSQSILFEEYMNSIKHNIMYVSIYCIAYKICQSS